MQCFQFGGKSDGVEPVFSTCAGMRQSAILLRYAACTGFSYSRCWIVWKRLRTRKSGVDMQKWIGYSYLNATMRFYSQLHRLLTTCSDTSCLCDGGVYRQHIWERTSWYLLLFIHSDIDCAVYCASAVANTAVRGFLFSCRQLYMAKH